MRACHDPELKEIFDGYDLDELRSERREGREGRETLCKQRIGGDEKNRTGTEARVGAGCLEQTEHTEDDEGKEKRRRRLKQKTAGKGAKGGSKATAAAAGPMDEDDDEEKTPKADREEARKMLKVAGFKNSQKEVLQVLMINAQVLRELRGCVVITFLIPTAHGMITAGQAKGYWCRGEAEKHLPACSYGFRGIREWQRAKNSQKRPLQKRSSHEAQARPRLRLPWKKRI